MTSISLTHKRKLGAQLAVENTGTAKLVKALTVISIVSVSILLCQFRTDGILISNGNGINS